MTAALAVHHPLTCQTCGSSVLVPDIPAGHVDPAKYVGPCCLKEKAPVTCTFCMTTDPDAYCGGRGCADVPERETVAYNEFPAGY